MPNLVEAMKFLQNLEFWEKLIKEIRDLPDPTAPRDLHLGFKWKAGDDRVGTVTRYICHPLLPIGGILDRLKNLLGGLEDPTTLDIHYTAADRPTLSSEQVLPPESMLLLRKPARGPVGPRSKS